MKRTNSIDDFLSPRCRAERITRVTVSDIRRPSPDAPFVCHKEMLINIMFIIYMIDAVLNVVNLVICVQQSRLGQAQQFLAVLSIELLAGVRGFSLHFMRKNLVRVINELDDLLPRSDEMQRRMNVVGVKEHLHRHSRILYFCSDPAYVFFSIVPISRYVLAYYILGTKDLSEPVADEFQQSFSWLPFNWKQRHSTYPATYIAGNFITIIGYVGLVQWERYATILIGLLEMHYNYLNSELLQIDARRSKGTVEETARFWKDLHQLMSYQRTLNNLSILFTNAFKMSVLASDSICAGSVTLHLYLLLFTRDVMAFAMFFSPTCILSYLIFDLARKGGLLEEAAMNIKDSLYHHNWYEGSLVYQKHVVIWMQYTYKPFRFHGYQQFELNMVHFQKMATLTYQLFTFLMSR